MKSVSSVDVKLWQQTKTTNLSKLSKHSTSDTEKMQ